MSLSRAELAAMDRDELIDYIADQTETVENLETLVHVQIEKRKELADRVEELADRVDDLEAENEQLRERLDEVDATAKGAIHAANDDSSDKSKTQIAADITRNLLVTRAATGNTAGDRKVTVGKIQEQAKPEHQLAWSIVDRAWSQLCEQWPQFYETTKDGQQALNVRADEVSPALAQVVQTHLGRDDLAKRFVGENSGGDHER